MHKRRLFCDADCVIFDSIKQIINLYIEDFGNHPDFNPINPSDIQTWDFKECTLATPEYIDSLFNSDRFFVDLPTMTHAKEVLNRLCSVYDVFIVSCGQSNNLMCKEKWFAEFIPEAKFIGVDFKYFPDKSHIDMNGGIFIDDVSRFLITSNAKDKYCFGHKYTWNNDWTGRWFKNWLEIYNALM